MKKVIGYLRLMRPANIVTAIADILAGTAIAGFYPAENYTPLLWLILSTTGLYGGGVVMNDVFDARLDAVERPERPIPSGLVPRYGAAILGIILLIGGVFFASRVSTLSAALALTTAVAAVIYDKWGKHHPFLGPLNMGVCRGLNLVLGLSIVPPQVYDYWFLGIVPVVYIAAITMISQGEVHGGKSSTIWIAAVLYAMAMGGILYVSISQDQLLVTLVFVAVWALMVFWPLINAMKRPQGPLIGRAVKAGVLALILMNAAWASAFGMVLLGCMIVLLLPVSILLAKAFAVT